MNQPSPPASRRKRRRKIWACAECRRRKVQCDRNLPACGGCRKAGQAASCHYFDAPEGTSRTQISSSVNSPTPVHAQATTSEQAFGILPSHYANLERRVDLLELRAGLGGPATATGGAPADFAHTTSKPPDDDTHLDYATYSNCDHTVLHGRTFRTKFHGGTFPGTLAQCIRGMSDYTTDAFAAFPVLEDIRQCVGRSQQAVSLRSDKCDRTSRGELIKFLAPKDDTDRDIQMYLEGIDPIYHILHRPTFERDYSQMWRDDQATADTRQMVLVILMKAIVNYCTMFEDEKQTNGHTRSWEDTTAMVDACEDWLQGTIQKYDNLLDFQLSFLLLFGRQLSAKWYKRTWVNAGNVLRICMCAGLHRHVDALRSNTTILTREMRARLWAAVAEFELQASFEHGMCAHTWPEESDIQSPLNVDDESLEQEKEPSESTTFTTTTFLAMSSRSLWLRHHLNSLLNRTNQTLTIGQVNTYTSKIYAHLDKLPSKRGRQHDAAHALLSINLLQYVLALHVRHLQRSNMPTEQRDSRIKIVEAAVRMVHHHSSATRLQSQAIEALYGDHIRIALSVCYAYITAEPKFDGIFSSTIELHSFEVLEAVISMMREKVQRTHGSRHHFWLIVAAFGIMKTKRNPEKKITYLEESVNAFSEPYHGLLEQQRLNVQLTDQVDVEPSVSDVANNEAFGAPTQLDLSIDEWFYQWCDNPITWPSELVPSGTDASFI